MARTLAQVDARLTKEIEARAKDQKALAARIAALEPVIPPIDPPPVDPPPVEPPPSGLPVRLFPAGSYTNLTLNVNEEWVFEPGAVVRGVLRWSAPNAVVRNLVARDAHETQVVLEFGAGGQLLNPLIEHTGTPANGKGYSSIGGNDQNRGVGTFGPLLVKGGTIDQKGYSWAGIEVWGCKGLVIDGVSFKGGNSVGHGEAMAISIPRSDGAIVRNCNLDLTTCFYGIEYADIENAQVLDCTAFATGTVDLNQQWRALVQMHPGSGAVRNITIARNRVTNYPALFNAAGDGHTIVDNCLQGGTHLQWGTFSGANKEVARNGVCA